jgi:hypothetical protein
MSDDSCDIVAFWQLSSSIQEVIDKFAAIGVDENADNIIATLNRYRDAGANLRRMNEPAPPNRFNFDAEELGYCKALALAS